MALPINSLASIDKPEVVRRTGNFSPSIWGDRFASFSVDEKVIKSYDEHIEILKEKTKKMFIASTTSSDSLENVRFIDLLCSLGVSYHFEMEIKQQLTKAFEAYTNLVHDAGFNLYTVANLFRLFRQHGHPMPCDVFEKFQNIDGKFNEALSGDAKGMLALYEASQLAMHGEQILDDALSFAKRNLAATTHSSSPDHLAKLIANSLHLPLHKCIPRLATRQFISFYEEEESKNEILLKFAKIDFNRLQLLYQEELYEITRWYRNLDISSNLVVYARDRIVEIYFLWVYGTYFEPRFSKSRIILSKFSTLVTIIDDTYDVYGTIEELRIFTDAIQRMEESSVVDELPEYMKFIYRNLLCIFDEWDQEMAKEGFPYNTPYARDALKEMARAYATEAEWCNKGYVPPVDEYMNNASITSGQTLLATCSFLPGVTELDAIPAFEWLNTQPKILVASQEISRIVNDIASHEAEQKRDHVASFVECYMKQYGVSKDVAIEAGNKRVDDAWKNLNEDFMKQISSSKISMPVLMRILNHTRTSEVAYRYGEGFNDPEKYLKVHIEALLIQPIPI